MSGRVAMVISLLLAWIAIGSSAEAAELPAAGTAVAAQAGADYVLRPYDSLQVTIPDLLGAGNTYNEKFWIGENGTIKLPELEAVKASGVTAQGLAQRVAEMLKATGLLKDPHVSVVVVPPSNTRKATCTVRYTTPTAFIDREPDAVRLAMGDALAITLGLPEDYPTGTDEEPQEVLSLVSQEGTAMGGEATVTCKIDPKLHPDLRPVAREVLECFVARLRIHWREAYVKAVLEPLGRKGSGLESAAMQAQARYDECSRQMAAFRRENGGLATEVVGDMMKNVELQKVQLEIDLAGKTARGEALQKRLAELAAKVGRVVQDDPVVAELQKVVELRQQEVEAAREALRVGKGGDDAVRKGELGLAEAKARLIERREAVSRAAGGDLMLRLNDEATLLSVDTQEIQKRLEKMAQEIQQLMDRQEKADKLEELVANAKTAKEQLDKARQALETDRAAYNEAAQQPPPEVTLQGKIKAE